MSDTPIYNELVAKFYLSRGLKPFTSEPVKPKVTVSDIRRHVGPNGTIHDYLTLMTLAGNETTVRLPVKRARRYDYFRL